MFGLRAGRLRESIAIQGYTEAQDTYGQSVKTYSTRETVRAGVRLVSGTEEIAGGKYNGRAVYHFTIRHTTLAQTDRIVYDSENYEIIEVNNVSDRDRIMRVTAARYD